MSIATDPGVCAPAEHHAYNLGVFIGRFQPFHNGHLHVIETALQHCDKLVVLVGSSNEPRDYFNPFTYEERMALIMTSLPPKLKPRVICRPLLDWTYNDNKWVLQVQEKVAEAKAHFKLDGFTKVALVGHQKDGTSYYLKMFPQWYSLSVPNHKGLSSTPIRESFFNGTFNADALSPLVPDVVASFMAKFAEHSDAYANMVEEYEYVRNYKKQFEGLAYPPIFQTVDAVVVQSGHILLVKRKSRPGKGLWALPGGFLNASERIEDAVYRELREETKIKVPEPVLRGRTVTQRTFDDPHRSARGRTITTAFLIHLAPDAQLPKVKGADDAEKAKWVPLADLKRSDLFEDHYHIIQNLTALL